MESLYHDSKRLVSRTSGATGLRHIASVCCIVAKFQRSQVCACCSAINDRRLCAETHRIGTYIVRLKLSNTAAAKQAPQSLFVVHSISAGRVLMVLCTGVAAMTSIRGVLRLLPLLSCARAESCARVGSRASTTAARAPFASLLRFPHAARPFAGITDRGR